MAVGPTTCAMPVHSQGRKQREPTPLVVAYFPNGTPMAPIVLTQEDQEAFARRWHLRSAGGASR